MSYQPFASAEPELQRFSLYAAGGRIYVQNARSCLIDIGEYENAGDGFAYRVTGDASVAGDGFAGADDVLRHLARQIDTAFLDIRFRTLPDQSEDYSLDLRHAAHRSVLLAADVDRIGVLGKQVEAPASAVARPASLGCV